MMPHRCILNAFIEVGKILNKQPPGIATLKQFTYSNPIVGSIAGFPGLIYSLPVTQFWGIPIWWLSGNKRFKEIYF
jgi:hypothetical protein